MASYTIAAAEVSTGPKTATQNVVDTVTFAGDQDQVEVVNNGTAALYFTVDGDIPTVAGGHCHYLPAGVWAVREVPSQRTRGTVVKLISGGAAVYAVSKGSTLRLGNATA